MTKKDTLKSFLFDDQAQAAIKRLDARLRADFDNVSDLSAAKLSGFRARSFLKGWELPILSVEGLTFLLLLDERFPFSSPRLAISPAPPIVQYPHIEEDGVLCIDADEQTNMAIDMPENDALRLIKEGAGLLEKLKDQKFCEDEFKREFLSYWLRKSERKKAPTIYSILNLEGSSREIVIWKHREKKKEVWLAAESKEQAVHWLTGFYGETSFFKKGKRFSKGYFLRCKNPPIPVQYPERNKDVLSLEGLKTDTDVIEFCRIFSNLPDKIDIVLGFETQDGFSPVAITISKGMAPQNQGYFGDSRVSHLVRNGKMDIQEIGRRYFEYAEDCPIARYNVVRADHAWVHGRDKNKDARSLLRKKVAYIGLGSIGSALAILLAKSGLGNGLLIDPQYVGFENIPRHHLGGSDVAASKAEGLVKRLRKDFPHLYGYRAVPTRWENIYQKYPAIFDDCDLIVITTGGHGSAGAQLSLNRLSQEKNLPPILYGWTEPFACAGHAVLLNGQEACLECGFTGDSFNNPATVWAGSTLQQVPACGQTFQPYREIELQNITAMIAGSVTDFLTGKETEDFHRMWLGSTRLLTENGGKWSDAIQSGVINKTPNGVLQLSGGWPSSKTCLACGKSNNEVSSSKQA